MTSILGEVLKAKANVNLDEFQDAINKVESKIVTMKTEIVESLQSCFALSEADIDRITSWSMEVNSIKSQADQLVNQFDSEREVYASSIKEIEDVEDNLVVSRKDVDILRALVGIVEDYEFADETMNDLEASIRLKRALERVKNLESEFQAPDDRKWLDTLQVVIQGHVSNVYGRVQKLWNDKFRFKRHQLSIDHYGCNVVKAVETLSNLEYFEKVWGRFVTQLWTEIFSRVSGPEYRVRISNPMSNQRGSLLMNGLTAMSELELEDVPVRDYSTVSTTSKSGRRSDATTMVVERDVTHVSTTSYANTGKSRCYIQVEKLEVPLTKVSLVLNHILDVLRVFAELFKDQPVLMSTLGKDLGPQICTRLSSKSVKSLILHNAEGDFQIVRQDIEDLKQFLSKLQDLGFTIPEGSELGTLNYFTENFESLFREQLRQDICTKSRNYIRADVHKTMRYAPPSRSPRNFAHARDLIKSPFTLQQSMEISISIYEMVKMLQQYLVDHPDDETLPDHCFSIYLAIVSIPKNESDSSDLIPLQAAIIHNNCWFMSHHALNFKSCEHHVPLLRTKADQAQSFLLRSIRSKLNSMISNAMNGLDTKVDAKTDCSLDFLIISEELIRLDLIFKGVLPAYAWKMALALLVDHTVNEMVSKVLQWDDISANTATELASAFIKFAVETSHLFKGEAKSIREIDAITSKAVRKWQRFRLLTFVLTASMSEIGDKWVQGCGPLSVEFTADEVRRLVRALFQNTDRRAAFLASIK